MQAWAYGVYVLAGYRAWGYDGHPTTVRPRGLWWRGYRQALAAGPAFLPSQAASRGTWAETEGWLHRLDTILATTLQL